MTATDLEERLVENFSPSWLVKEYACVAMLVKGDSTNMRLLQHFQLLYDETKFVGLDHVLSFIHYVDLYSASSRLLLRSAPDSSTAK